MAIILAIFAQAYASETENQSAVSAEQAVVAESAAVAELGNNVPETAVAAPKASVKKKRMDHFSVEFSDDVELAGHIKTDFKELVSRYPDVIYIFYLPSCKFGIQVVLDR